MISYAKAHGRALDWWTSVIWFGIFWITTWCYRVNPPVYRRHQMTFLPIFYFSFFIFHNLVPFEVEFLEFLVNCIKFRWIADLMLNHITTIYQILSIYCIFEFPGLFRKVGNSIMTACRNVIDLEKILTGFRGFMFWMNEQINKWITYLLKSW